MKVAVVDHGMGNLRSVTKALETAGARPALVGDTTGLDDAAALCVPGQGIFGRCMDSLAATGLDEGIKEWVGAGRPYFGICLGMQVLFESSEERGPIAGLGLLGGTVRRLRRAPRIPHIGWNVVAGTRGGPGGSGNATGDEGGYFYFDHSYAAHPADESVVSGWCEHGERFAAAVATDSVVAVQFHPEKSGATGIEFLRGWVKSL